MKLLYSFLLFATVAAIPIEDGHENGENGWYVPQINGSWIWMDKNLVEIELFGRQINLNALLDISPVSYYLYTKANPNTAQKITATLKSIGASNFNASKPTRFIIHGWTQSYTHSLNSEIRSAWFSRGAFNIISVDWARARADYISSVLAVPGVGQNVANMIKFLVKNYNMPLKTLQVIGHSLGAHVAGCAGKNIQSGKINTIIGVDAALPLYSYSDTSKRLASTDALYVDSIHTSGGKFGFLKPIGKRSFYLNGGVTQPNCGKDLLGTCSHGISVTYYAEAVRKDNFPTKKCSGYEKAISESCESNYSCVRMGGMTNSFMINGVYYVPVNENSPFGKGGNECTV